MVCGAARRRGSRVPVVTEMIIGVMRLCVRAAVKSRESAIVERRGESEYF